MTEVLVLLFSVASVAWSVSLFREVVNSGLGAP